MKLLVPLLMIYILSSATPILASEVSYDYIEAGYYHSHSEATYDDHVYEGVVVKGSKSINDSFYLAGTFSYTEASWDDPGEHEEQDEETYTISVGGHAPILSDTDLVLELSYIYWDRDWTQKYNNSSTVQNVKYTDDYYVTDLGLRHMVNPETEINGGLEAIRGGSLNSDDSELAYVGIVQKITDTLSISAVYKSNAFPVDNDYWNTSISLRSSY